MRLRRLTRRAGKGVQHTRPARASLCQTPHAARQITHLLNRLRAVGGQPLEREVNVPPHVALLHRRHAVQVDLPRRHHLGLGRDQHPAAVVRVQHLRAAGGRALEQRLARKQGRSPHQERGCPVCLCAGFCAPHLQRHILGGFIECKPRPGPQEDEAIKRVGRAAGERLIPVAHPQFHRAIQGGQPRQAVHPEVHQEGLAAHRSAASRSEELAMMLVLPRCERSPGFGRSPVLPLMPNCPL